MLVSHRYKFIFIKTYKTAGTSTEAFFQRYCLSPSDEANYVYEHHADESITPYGIVGRRLTGKRGTGKWINHRNVEFIKRGLGMDIFNSYTKICNIRNPFDIVVSAYFYTTYNDRKLTDDALENWLKQPKVKRYLLKNKAMWLSPGVEYEYVRHESIEEDIKRICEKLGISVDSIKLPKYKVSQGRKNYRSYYNETTKKIVEDLYRTELKLFKYAF